MKTDFHFAGFAWPRNVVTLTPLSGLREKRELRKVCGPYYHAPKPNTEGMGFYLDDVGQPFTRWKWCDDVVPHIRHSGWFTDLHGDGEKIRGIVIFLPHGRFMAGWAMGEKMCATVDGKLYDDEVSAAYSADFMAENAAQREIEHWQQWESENA